MKRAKRVARIRSDKRQKEVKFHSDFQTNWQKHIPILKKFELASVDKLSMSGDAPKDFSIDREYRPGHRSKHRPTEKFIAKVGSKFYPLESVIEQLITRIGQCFQVTIADSKLRILDGQVRFLSRYFLKRGEQLTHGAEIYEYSLGKENYKELSENKEEREFFTFEMTCGAIRSLFPEHAERIIAGYIEMLCFDALIGHNDRHPYNWGVIVPIKKQRNPRFSPVFDTARALFWNIPETRIVQMLTDAKQLEKYILGCSPPICWTNRSVDFFELIGLIWMDCTAYRNRIEKYLDGAALATVFLMMESEFRYLLSAERFELIKRCLSQRQHKLIEVVNRKRREVGPA